MGCCQSGWQLMGKCRQTLTITPPSKVQRLDAQSCRSWSKCLQVVMVDVTSRNTHITNADTLRPSYAFHRCISTRRATPDICKPRILDIPQPDPVSPYSKVSHFLLFPDTAFSPYSSSPYEYAPHLPVIPNTASATPLSRLSNPMSCSRI